MVTEELSSKLHLDMFHISRDDTLVHMTDISLVFYGNDTMDTVWDGTYHIQKSSQYDF